MKTKTLVISLLVLAAAIGGLIWGIKSGKLGKGKGKKVAVTEVKTGTIIETVTASGKIYPEQEVKLSSEVSGEVVALYVKEGDSVKAGDLLLEINASIYQSLVSQSEAGLNQVRSSKASAEAGLKQAGASLEQARRTYQRQKQLLADKIISQNDFENAELALQQAESAYETAQQNLRSANYSISSGQAQVNQSRENLQRTKIFAPGPGIVSLLNVKLGEKVVGTAQMAGTELIRIADLNNMVAEVEVNENDVVRMQIGDTADVEVDAYINRKFKGVVTQIAYSSQTTMNVVSTSQATNFKVKILVLPDSYADLINIENGIKYPFRPGMNTTVDIKTNSKENILIVPIQSVTVRNPESVESLDESKPKKKEENVKEETMEMVFIVEGVQAKAVRVTTGVQDAEYIEITSGLKKGQKVVSAPFKLITKTLRNDDMIEIVDEDDLFDGEEEK